MWPLGSGSKVNLHAPFPPPSDTFIKNCIDFFFLPATFEAPSSVSEAFPSFFQSFFLTGHSLLPPLQNVGISKSLNFPLIMFTLFGCWYLCILKLNCVLSKIKNLNLCLEDIVQRLKFFASKSKEHCSIKSPSASFLAQQSRDGTVSFFSVEVGTPAVIHSGVCRWLQGSQVLLTDVKVLRWSGVSFPHWLPDKQPHGFGVVLQKEPHHSDSI